MKTHLNLQTTDLDRSVTYYSTLLDAAPAKRYDDYALFLTDDPGLELALDRSSTLAKSESAHYGIVVDSSDAVDAAATRLTAAGLDIDLEHESVCCYAKQTKVWSTDPDGRRWEVYTVLEETAERDDPDRACCRDDAGQTACC